MPTVKLLLDMNLSPLLVDILQQDGWDVVHWSQIGDPTASDRELMTWASDNGRAVAHDLDFSAVLAATQATSPSVLQVRTLNVMPGLLRPILTVVLTQYESDIVAGAIVTVDEARSRVRILPLRR
ncbi:MAG: DUF5615 family PIN-like protein [Planctomycetaceae bacterium]|nr:DUF5615 family PIN-like protein [Planctomycetaceae bacterium]